jgi:endoglucanase
MMKFTVTHISVGNVAILLFAISTLLFQQCDKNPTGDSQPILNPSEWEIHEQNKLLGKGINLGNALDAPYEGYWGCVLKEQYFSHIKALGFNSVRIPVRWSAHCLNTFPYTIDETFFNRVIWAVDQSLKNDLRVIINIHHFDSLTQNPADNRIKLLALWGQIANRFCHYGPQLYFELFNEPKDNFTPALWNSYAAEALSAVRYTNPYRSVLIGPGLWNSIDGLPSLTVPPDSFLILTMHYYKPDFFTHQGAAWVEGSNGWKGTKWRGGQNDTAMIISHFDRIDAWATANNKPVNLGEFGAFDSADALSRTLYTSYIVKQAVGRHWSFAYWKYNYDFGIYNDTTNTVKDYLLKALLSPDAAFDSCSALAKLDTGSVDPGSAQFVILDDFDDTLFMHNSLVNRYMVKHSTIADSSFCWWSAWYNDSSAILDEKGTRILTWEEADTTGAKPNLPLLTSDSGASGRCLHLKGHLYGGNYPFLGVGTTCPGKYNRDWFDFSELTSISFRAKGYGEMRVDFVTDTVLNKYSEKDNWGSFGCDFSVDKEWKLFVIPVKNLKPKRYSKTEKDKIKWTDAMKKVCSIDFSINQSYGMEVNDSIEVYLDDIRLYGMSDESFGLGN